MPADGSKNVQATDIYSRPVKPHYASTWFGHCAKLYFTTATRFLSVMYNFTKLWCQGISEDSVYAFLNNTSGAIHKAAQLLSKETIKTYFSPFFWSLGNDDVLESCMKAINRAKTNNKFDKSCLETIKQSEIDLTEDQLDNYEVLGSGSLNEVIRFKHAPNVVYKVLSKSKAIKFHADCNYLKPIITLAWLAARAASVFDSSIKMDGVTTILNEIQDFFYNEIDLNAEARNTKILKKGMEDFSDKFEIFGKNLKINTTSILESEYSNNNLIVMEYVPGCTLSNKDWASTLFEQIQPKSYESPTGSLRKEMTALKSKSGFEKNQLMETLRETLMAFELASETQKLNRAMHSMNIHFLKNHQISHADPHDGNFMINYDESSDEVVLTYIDAARLLNLKSSQKSGEQNNLSDSSPSEES